MANSNIAYLFLRLGIGISFFGHGLVRMPKLLEFSNWMVDKFKDSMLPDVLVIPFSYALPVGEFVVGLLLTLGLFTKQTAIGGGVIILMLIFGSCAIEEWNALPSQMIHILFIVILLTQITHNQISIDQTIKK